MPYPSPVVYPSPFLAPGSDPNRILVGLGSLVLGGTDEFGVRTSVTKFDGWGSPSPTLTLTQRARGHGATASESFFGSRFMVIGGLVHTDDAAAQDAFEDRLSLAVSLDQFQFLALKAGRVRNTAAQRQGEVIVNPITDKLASYSILIVAKDPLKYGDLVTQTTLLPSSSGGMVYPVTYPVTYTGVSNSGVIRVNNPGNTQAPVWLRIDGPIPAGGWTVTHVGKKQSLIFAVSLALAAGEFVTVDMSRREVLAQGQSARAGYVTSRGWFTLDPGDNDIAFSAQNYSATAQLTVSTKPAWS